MPKAMKTVSMTASVCAVCKKTLSPVMSPVLSGEREMTAVVALRLGNGSGAATLVQTGSIMAQTHGQRECGVNDSGRRSQSKARLEGGTTGRENVMFSGENGIRWGV